ncbi:DEAD/DEAH box helicase [Sporolactobacillus shoreae]|uniref:DEAD/DEAH box helicase n=1 Tax=Sporolactobacillus shoreae TaxID=1465501 RepID=A0A4Z0GMX1_9BACL|nr:DEAD/DEAH box helicase [Sporolactobacillus shoreae]TGA97223.1 DEAD/DEAH box helicase [Sporolactobacillus shoreae]
MNRYLQITFVPHIEKGWNFYIWLTDEEGNNLPFPGDVSGKGPIPEWLGDLSPYRYFRSSAQFAGDAGDFPVSGALMPMNSAFKLMRDRVLDDGDIRAGRTFQWFGRIADALKVLLENGQFYPFFYHLERGKHEHCYFCEWMPDIQTLDKSGLFADWLGSLPHLSFSISDLQDEKVRQWLYLLIIFWTNTLVHDTALSVIPQLENKPAAGLIEANNPSGSVPEKNIPFHSSGEPWVTTANPLKVQEMNQLEREIGDWTHPVSSHNPQALTSALLAFRKARMEQQFSPEQMKIILDPADPDDPFSKDAVWEYETVVEGWKNARRTEWSLEKLQSRSPLGRNSWLEERINRLTGEVPDHILNFLAGKAGRLITSEELSDLFQYRNELGAVSVSLSLPDNLDVKESDDLVAIDLNIRSEDENQRSLFSLSSLINYDWRIAVGDIQLSVSEFRQLVSENQSFIRHEGEWIHLPMKRMVKAFTEMGGVMEIFDKKPSVAGALRLDALTHKKRNKLIKVHLERGLDDYLNHIINKPSKIIPVPEGFSGQLRPYQKKGFTWLANLRHQRVGGCLADDMGLGKTVQAIAYLDHCKTLPAEPVPERMFQGPALVICPTSLVANWNHEFRTFSPELDIYTHHGASRLHGQLLEERLRSSDVMVTSYAIFTKESEALKQIYWKSVILDEAQAIKNPHAQKTRAIRTISSAHRLVLTGTPIENRLEELWSIMDFLNPGYLGSLERFRKQFIGPVEKKSSRSKTGELTKIIRPFILRREKTDRRIIQDLPDKFETKKTCFLSKDQASLYQTVVNRLTQSVGTSSGIKRKGMILSALTKLKQVCDHPALVLGKEGEQKKSGKMDLFYDLLEPLFDRNEKVLVFTQYVQMGQQLLQETRKRHPDADVFFLHGSLSAEQREKLIQRFQSGVRKKTLFILSLKAGGVGINLTAAGYVFHYDRWWNPAVEEQATDRAYRIGQERNVHVYKLICEGTLEERIDLLIERKKKLQRQILGQGDGWLTEMSDQEIFDLIKLREGVI